MATAATGMPQHSPDSWADSPMESPNTTFHQKPNGVGAGVGAGASYFSGGKATPKPPMGFSQPQHQPAGWQPPPSAASPHLGGPAISPTPLSNPHQAPPAEAVRSDTSPTAPGMQDQVTTSEYSSVVEMIKSANPSTLRQALRDHWDQCFMGSDYHVAFIVSMNPLLCFPPSDRLCMYIIPCRVQTQQEPNIFVAASLYTLPSCVLLFVPQLSSLYTLPGLAPRRFSRLRKVLFTVSN